MSQHVNIRAASRTERRAASTQRCRRHGGGREGRHQGERCKGRRKRKRARRSGMWGKRKRRKKEKGKGVRRCRRVEGGVEGKMEKKKEG